MRRNYLAALALGEGGGYGANDPTLAYYRGLKASQIPQEIALKNMLMEKAQMEMEDVRESRNVLRQIPWTNIADPVERGLTQATAMSSPEKALDLLKTKMMRMSNENVARLEHYSKFSSQLIAGAVTPDDLDRSAEIIEKYFPGMSKAWPKSSDFRNPDGTYNMPEFNNWRQQNGAMSAWINREAANIKATGRLNEEAMKTQREIIKQESSTEREIVKGIEKRKTKKAPKDGAKSVSPVDLKNYELIKATGDQAKIDEFRRRFKEANKFDIEDAGKEKSKKKGKLSDWIEE